MAGILYNSCSTREIVNNYRHDELPLVCLSVRPSVCVSVCLSVCVCMCVRVCGLVGGTAAGGVAGIRRHRVSDGRLHRSRHLSHSAVGRLRCRRALPWIHLATGPQHSRYDPQVVRQRRPLHEIPSAVTVTGINCRTRCTNITVYCDLPR